MTLNKLLLVVCMLFCAQFAFSQSVFGKWKTVDDRSGKPRAIVHVYEKNNLMYAKIEKILQEGEKEAVCEKCKGARKNKPIVGMLIFNGLKRSSDNVWKGKELFDPEHGMTFRGKVWLNPKNSDELKVRGYLAFLYRTQTWQRVKE